MKGTKNYSVYFELYGKTMKAKILAESITEAQQKVKDKIIFHKTVVEDKDEFNQVMDLMNGIIDALDGKK
jgi:hypothetical protein